MINDLFLLYVAVLNKIFFFSEIFFLSEGSLYDDIRSKLKQTIKSVLEDGTDLRSLFKDPTHVRDLTQMQR